MYLGLSDFPMVSRLNEEDTGSLGASSETQHVQWYHEWGEPLNARPTAPDEV